MKISTASSYCTGEGLAEAEGLTDADPEALGLWEGEVDALCEALGDTEGLTELEGLTDGD